MESLNSLDEKPALEESKKATADVQVENSEVEDDNKLVIDPELEEMFVAYKVLIDKLIPIVEELSPLNRRGGQISARTGELVDEAMAAHGEERKRLWAERERLLEEQNEIEAARRPLLARSEQLQKEFDEYLRTHHGMNLEEFHYIRKGTERETWIAWISNRQ